MVPFCTWLTILFATGVLSAMVMPTVICTLVLLAVLVAVFMTVVMTTIFPALMLMSQQAFQRLFSVFWGQLVELQTASATTHPVFDEIGL